MSEYGEWELLGTIIVAVMLPSAEICRRAHMARDPRFDGLFVVGVLSTGVFCRPICAARTPRADNSRYFATAAAAFAAGYRPCRRCRPEGAPALSRWTVGSATVLRALELVDVGFLDDHNTSALAARVGVGVRQLSRLFQAELGASPAALARTRRLFLARHLLDESTFSVTDVAMAAGYGSVRRFNTAFRAAFGSAPSAPGNKPASAGDSATLRLQLRQPYHSDGVFAFLHGRSVPGIETATAHRYCRKWGRNAWVELMCDEPRENSRALAPSVLRVTISASAVAKTASILARVRRLFDLDADSTVIDDHLAAAPHLASQIAKAPGVRVPGVWDAFEGAVRAVLGQQVSVARATALAGKLCERYGDDGVFPAAETLARADVATIGMPRTRGAAISAIAQRTAAEGDGWLRDANTLRAGFTAIRGLGPWTAEYAAMRVAGDPDAFPDSDWGVLKALGALHGAPVTNAAARRWAEPLRPWRAYACMRLWSLNGAR